MQLDIAVIFFLALAALFGALAVWARVKIRNGDKLIRDPLVGNTGAITEPHR
jgi:hypothetical protein